MGLLGTMSAIGTAMGPTLGGVLISMAGWRAIFVVTALGGAVAFWLARRFLPADRMRPETPGGGLDVVGTVFLAMTLGAYALAMTIGRGHFGSANVTLLGAAALGVMVFILVQMTVASPLIRLALFKAPAFSAAIASSALVSTVVMATLVVGPFYLSRTLGLDAGLIGFVLSVGPFCAALTGVSAGRLADRLGAQRMTRAGLVGIATGTILLSVLPATLGILGYVLPLIVMTVGYALFQTANNTAVMADIDADQRGIVSGLLNLSRNLGLITGASAMGAVFAAAADITTAPADAVARGMRVTFAVATILIAGALAIAVVTYRRHSHRWTVLPAQEA
jgi:MFS family permease